MALVLAMVLAGCGYDGPSVEEIADTALERQEVSYISQQMKQLLQPCGKVTIGKDITAWGQTNAAFSVTVNTAELFVMQTNGYYLPNNGDLYNEYDVKWEGAGNEDITLEDAVDYLWFKDKSDGKTADFNFTITDKVDTTKIVKGSLTVTSSYDASTIGVENINKFFEDVLRSNIEYGELTTTKAISQWGQTDAAYTIAKDVLNYGNVTIYSPKTAPVLRDNNWNWTKAEVEWKSPVIPADITAYISSGNSYVNGCDYDYVSYSLSTSSTTAQQAKFEFRITSGDQTISGVVTVNIKKVTNTEQLEEDNLKSLRSSFDYSFDPRIGGYNDNGIITKYIDKGITAFGQEDVLYTITVRGDSDDIDGDGNYYSTISLPYSPTWTTKTANAAVVLSGTSLNVYQNKSGTAEFSFTYTYNSKTVKGTVKVVVVK